MPQFTEGDDLTVLIRFVRALALVLLTLATLAITLAMFWRDVGLDSFFDRWFGHWSEWQLTALATVMIFLSIAALRGTQRSEMRCRTRSTRIR